MFDDPRCCIKSVCNVQNRRIDKIYCRLYHQYAEYANNGSETMVPSEDLRWCIGCVGKTMCRVYPRPRVNTTSYLHSRNDAIAPPPSKRSSPMNCITPTKCTRRGTPQIVSYTLREQHIKNSKTFDDPHFCIKSVCNVQNRRIN